jgi:hypothetical protein
VTQQLTTNNQQQTIGKNIGESAKRGMTSINQLRIIAGQPGITRSNE